jgi:hypothetical protein
VPAFLGNNHTTTIGLPLAFAGSGGQEGSGQEGYGVGAPIIVPTVEDNVDASGDVVVTSYIGLVLFMFGQLSFIAIISFLRLLHRRQAYYYSHFAPSSSSSSSGQHQQQQRHQWSVSSTDSSTFFLGSRALGFNGDAIIDDDAPSATLEINQQHELGAHGLSSSSPYGPPRKRPLWRRLLALFLAFTLLTLIVVLCHYPFVRFKYTGIIKPYLIVSHEDYDVGEDDDGSGASLTLALNLAQMLRRIKTSMVPKSYALFYTVTGTVLLLANPALLAAAAIVSACIPDKLSNARRAIEEFIEVLQCWCAGEAIVVAT